MALPPLDVYRRPFVEPLGHLVLQAARVDNLWIDFCCVALDIKEEDRGGLVSDLRHWDEKPAKRRVSEALDALGDNDQSNIAKRLVSDFGELRNRRHRAIHDAVEVGIFGNPEDGYSVRPLHVGFTKVDRETQQRIQQISPEIIVDLVSQFYELAEDLEGVLFHISRLGRLP